MGGGGDNTQHHCMRFTPLLPLCAISHTLLKKKNGKKTRLCARYKCKCDTPGVILAQYNAAYQQIRSPNQVLTGSFQCHSPVT